MGSAVKLTKKQKKALAFRERQTKTKGKSKATGADVDEEEERHAALRAELDEVRRLERRLREQDPVVRHDPDRVAVDVREALRVVSVRAASRGIGRGGGRCSR